ASTQTNSLPDASWTPFECSHRSGGLSHAGVLHRDGIRRLFVTDSINLEVRDERSGEVVFVISNAHEKVIRCARWSPDGARILSACAKGEIKFWDATNGRALNPTLTM